MTKLVQVEALGLGSGRHFGIAGAGGSAVDRPPMRVGRVGLLAIALGCLAGRVRAADNPSRQTRTYRNDHLSVQLVGVPLEDAVAEIGQATGAQVSGTVRDPRNVSAEFEDLPLEEALHRLLGEQ